MAHGAQFGQGGRQEALPAEAGVDGHDEDEVEFVHDVFEAGERGGGIEDEPRFQAVVLDLLQAAVNVDGGFGMEADVVRARFGEWFDKAVHRAGHKVHVNRRGDAVVAQGFADRRAEAEVGDEVVVHHVEVDDVRAGGEDGSHVVAEAGEIGGEDGGGNEGWAHDVCSCVMYNAAPFY